MLVSAPLIGKLRGRPRLWAYRKIKRGDFGRFVEAPSGALLVELCAVEAAEGICFSMPQLAAAGISIPNPEEV